MAGQRKSNILEFELRVPPESYEVAPGIEKAYLEAVREGLKGSIEAAVRIIREEGFDRPGRLRTRTGQLKGAIEGRLRKAKDTVTLRLGIFQGPTLDWAPLYERTRGGGAWITPKDAKALSFVVGGRRVFIHRYAEGSYKIGRRGRVVAKQSGVRLKRRPFLSPVILKAVNRMLEPLETALGKIG